MCCNNNRSLLGLNLNSETLLLALLAYWLLIGGGSCGCGCASASTRSGGCGCGCGR